jgi:hypothetical protein
MQGLAGTKWVLKGIFVLGMMLALQACEQKDVLPPAYQANTRSYLHLSHPRTATNGSIASRLDEVDYEPFDMLWLGGDLQYGTSQDDATMDYVDALFDLGSPQTLLALGNHEYASLPRISAYTDRPAFFTHHENGITFVVLDTQDSLSNIVGAQREMLDLVLDTLEHSTHLVILHHKLIWMPDNPNLEPLIPDISNIGIADDFNSLNRNNFYPDFFPRLAEIQLRGIPVLCVGGDMGNHAKHFAYRTSEGIHFLGSGISYQATEQENQVIVFTHDLNRKALTWKFVAVSELL